MNETKQALEKTKDALSDQQFEHRYEFLTRQTLGALKELSETPIGWQNLLAPCGLGLMLVAFSFKALGGSRLTPIEFLLVFLVATLLLILGSYFRTKLFQEGSKAIQKTGENFLKRFEARTGPLNPPRKESESPRSSSSTDE